MSDLFHEALPDEAIDRVFAVMALTPHITYMVLTKRAERLARYFSDLGRVGEQVAGYVYDIAMDSRRSPLIPKFPLLNAWLGVSVEDRKRLDRIDWLRKTPSAIRFLSLEPLLEDLGKLDLSGIDWVISGGESGPGARPAHPYWFRDVRDQCKAAGVAFFHKQNGAFLEVHQAREILGDDDHRISDGRRRTGSKKLPVLMCGDVFVPLGKHTAGRLLDGVEHNELPAGVGVVEAAA
jgi:protein gp37